MSEQTSGSGADKAAVVQAFLDRERNAVIARGSFGGLFAAFEEHAARLELMPDPAALSMMREGLAAATLHLAVHPPDEFTAWTLNIMEPRMNFFICGDNNQFIVTGRVYSQHVKTTGTNRLFLESQRPRREPSRSMLEVEGSDVLAIFEQFYEKSEQIPSRLLSLGSDAYVFIQGMPRVEKEWIHSLEPGVVAEYLEQELEPIEERTYRFQCGCNIGKVFQVVHSAYADKADELFLAENQVEVACPRCGQRYWITREDFDLGPNRVGTS